MNFILLPILCVLIAIGVILFFIGAELGDIKSIQRDRLKSEQNTDQFLGAIVEHAIKRKS